MRFLTAVAAIVVTSTAESQSVIGHLSGRIIGESEAPVPGVAVVVTGRGLFGSRSTVTDSTGRFDLLSLPVGRYELRARKVGFQALVVRDIEVRISITATLPPLIMARLEAVQLPERVVTAETGVDPRSTASRLTLDSRQLDLLPVDRNSRMLAILAPLATPSFYPGDEVNIAGATGPENVWFVDGINITSPINGATATDLPYNFIRQVEVRTTAAEVDASNALGGVLNVVTPSGSNQFEGELYFFHSGARLQGVPRVVPGSAAMNTRGLSDAGINLAGPLVRDRAWFFAAYNPTNTVNDVRYGSGAPLAASRQQHLYAGKVTAALSPTTTLALTVIGDPTDEKLVGPSIPIFGQPASVVDRKAVEGIGTRRGLNAALRVFHQLSGSTQVELSHSRSTRRETTGPRDAGTEPTFIDYVTGEWSGGYGHSSSIRGARHTTRATVSWRGNYHLVRTGLEYDEQSIDAVLLSSAETMGGYVQRVDTSSFIWFQFAGHGRLNNRNPSAFIRDSWELTPNVTLNTGVRWSGQHLSAKNTVKHTVEDGLQPQLSIVYRSGNGDRRVFLSYARVADQLAMWFGNYYGPSLQRVAGYPQDPRIDTSGVTCLQCFSQETPPFGFDSEKPIRGLLQDEVSGGFSTHLGTDLDLSLRVLHRELRSVIDDASVGSNSVFVIGNPGRGRLASYPSGTRRYDALELTLEKRSGSRYWYAASYVLSRTRGNYTGLYTTELAAATPHASAQFDYTEQLVNGTGLLPNDRTHTFKLHGAATIGQQLSVGATALVASGTALSEYGTIPVGAPYWSFVTSRGSAGRTPSYFDLGLRALYDLPLGGRVRPQLVVDVLHAFSPRRAVMLDQIHYTSLDDDGNHTAENPNYRNPTAYQPPFLIRIGSRARF